MPGDKTLEKVDTGNAFDRVYVLRHRSDAKTPDDHKYSFYWIQEPDASKDYDAIQKINDVLQTGTIPPPTDAAGAAPGGGDNPWGQRGRAAPASTPAVTTNDLASVLAQLGVTATPQANPNAAAPAVTTSTATTSTGAQVQIESFESSGDPEEDAELQAALAASLRDDEEESKRAEESKRNEEGKRE